MKVTELALSHISTQYPHSLEVVKAFVPLINAKEELIEELPQPKLTPKDKKSFVQGKAWLLPEFNKKLYLDKAFLEKAPAKIAKAIKEGFPALKKDVEILEEKLVKDPKLCFDFVSLAFDDSSLEEFALENKVSEDVAKLFCIHLSCAAAERVARAAELLDSENKEGEKSAWSFAYCPICGKKPHASYLQNKEGQRFLQCSLCKHEWQYSRTSCPTCGQEALKELPLYFFEDKKTDRAEACELCKHYILGVDMRERAGEVPLELFLLCMLPLDILMQEKGYIPILDSVS